MASQQFPAAWVGTAELMGVMDASLLTLQDEILEPFASPAGPVSDKSNCPSCEKTAENPPGFLSAVVVIAERVPLGRIWKTSTLFARRSTTARNCPSGLTDTDEAPRPVPESKVVEFEIWFRWPCPSTWRTVTPP